METHKHFTVVAYSDIDFLIPSMYVVAGVYLHVDKGARNLMFNRETLPHIHIGNLLEQEFFCTSTENYNVVLVMQCADFASDVCRKICDYTATAFPASGYLALSVNGAVSSKVLRLDSLRLLPPCIRGRLSECGICAMGFSEAGRKQILVSPDMLLRKFFATDMLKGND